MFLVVIVILKQLTKSYLTTSHLPQDKSGVITLFPPYLSPTKWLIAGPCFLPLPSYFIFLVPLAYKQIEIVLIMYLNLRNQNNDIAV